MSRSIQILPELDGPISPIETPKSITGIVGYGRGAYINEVRGPYQSLTELATDMDNVSGGSPNDLDYDGHSAVYRWCREFMANGARKLYVVEPTISALQTITCTGNGSKRSFDLIVDKTGGAGALTRSPIPGTLHVEHPIATDLVENTDYIVDWSQGIVYFKTAPAAGANNIQISWNEYTTTNVSNAFNLLENKEIKLVGGAYFPSDNSGYDLIDEIRDHITAVNSLRNYRHAFIGGYYGDVANIVAKAYSSRFISKYASRSGYFNDNLLDPSISWLEFVDLTAVVAGIYASRNPWVSGHEKVAVNLNQRDDFNSTQMATLNAGYTNYFRFDGRDSYRLYQGYTSEGASAIDRYVDSNRLWIYVGDVVYNDLLSKNIIGNVQIERDQMLTVEQTMFNSLIKIYREGGIGNPKELFDSVGLKPINSQLIDALKKAPSDRTTAENDYIQAAQLSRSEDVRMYYDALGSLHELIIYLGGR